MKRLVILTIVMLISASPAMAHQPQGSRSRTMGGRQDYSRARYSRSYSSGTYRAHPYIQRSYSGYGNYRQTYSNYGGSYRYNYGSRPSTNINVRYNERWDSMGGERSYEQSPDLLGKIIDGGIILGALSIIR
jgi:hypothetical protein